MVEIAFHNDRIGRSSRKNAPPLQVRMDTPSLEERLARVMLAVQERCAALSKTAVSVECGTHRGTIYTRPDRVPIGAFTISPPLQYNGKDEQ